MHTFEDKERAALELIRAQMATAQNPIVLCSFGKDSLVLLHLCLRFRKVPAMFFRFSRFSEKSAHALAVAQAWDLEVFDMWPTTIDEYQHDEFFEVFHGYMTGRNDYIHLASGIRKYEEGDPRFLCAVEDLLGRPRSFSHTYGWDVTFHGQKGTDDPEVGRVAPITQPVSQLGMTRVVVPFIDWTDADIWTYIKRYDLPYDRARYDQRVEAVSPDKFPTCYRCIDTQHRGESVECPKYHRPILNIAKSPEEHEAWRNELVGKLNYCEVSGAPRSTHNPDHL